MTIYRFEIPGRPVPWKRQRTKGKVRFPAEGQREAKAAVQAACLGASGFRRAHKGVAVEMTVHAVFKLPDRMSKSDTRRMGHLHAYTPDADNLAKLVKDALNGVAYDDDCQVASLHVKKQWSDHFRTAVTVELVDYRAGYASKNKRAAGVSDRPDDADHSNTLAGGIDGY